MEERHRVRWGTGRGASVPSPEDPLSTNLHMLTNRKLVNPGLLGGFVEASLPRRD